MTPTHVPRRGVTLLELLVTLTILAIIAAVTTLAVRRIDTPDARDPHVVLANAIRDVLASGRPARIHLVIDGLAANATVLPDGEVIADSAFHLDRFTGRPRHGQP